MSKEDLQLNLQQNSSSTSYELDLQEYEKRQKLLAEQERTKARHKKVCQDCLKSMPSSAVTWVFLLLIFVGGYAAGMIAQIIKPGVSGDFVIGTLANAVFTFVFFSRFVGTCGLGKRFSVDRHVYLKKMPDEVTPVIQDLYVTMTCRRCIHYWLTFGLSCLSLLSALYMTIAGTIASSSLSLTTSWTSPTSWNIAQKVIVAGVSILIILWLQYSILDSKNKGALRSLEYVYGKDKLVNDCLLCHKVGEVNRKYKTITFAIVCLFGCAFYIFFKKMICSVFDKSFSV